MTDSHRFPGDQPVFAALAAERRRLVTLVLHEESRPLPVADLARAVAARETGQDPASVPGETRRRVRLSLRHAHLPKLAAAGLIRRGTDGVELTSSPRMSLAVELALATTGSNDPSGAKLFDALADRRRRVAVAVLQSAGEAWRLTELAERIADAVGFQADRLAVSLDHVHLPKLDDTGVVTYDRDDRRAAFEGLPGPFDWALEELDPAAGVPDGGPAPSGDSRSPVR